MINSIEDTQIATQDFYVGMGLEDIPFSVFVELSWQDNPINIYTVEEKTGKFLLEGKNLEINQLLGYPVSIKSGIDGYGEFWNLIFYSYDFEENFALKLYKDRYSTLPLLYSFESLLNNEWQDDKERQKNFMYITILSDKYIHTWNSARFSGTILGIYVNDTLIKPSLSAAEMQKLFSSCSLSEKEEKLTVVVKKIQSFLSKKYPWQNGNSTLVENESSSAGTLMADDDDDDNNIPL